MEVTVQHWLTLLCAHSLLHYPWPFTPGKQVDLWVRSPRIKWRTRCKELIVYLSWSVPFNGEREVRGKPGRVTHQIPGRGRIRFKWKRMFPRKLHDRLVKHQTSAISSQQPWPNWSTSAGFISRGEITAFCALLVTIIKLSITWQLQLLRFWPSIRTAIAFAVM